MKKIVITGGPGSGKTVITAALAAEQPDKFVLVPEAATQVYTQLQTRWDQLDLAGRHDAQRRIHDQQGHQDSAHGQRQAKRPLAGLRARRHLEPGRMHKRNTPLLSHISGSTSSITLC